MSKQSYDAGIDTDVANILHTEATPVNHIFLNNLLINLGAMASFLGLFVGTIGMNELLSVCPKCGKVTPLSQPEKMGEAE